MSNGESATLLAIVCANPRGREALGDVGNGNSNSGLAARAEPAHIRGASRAGPLQPNVADQRLKRTQEYDAEKQPKA